MQTGKDHSSTTERLVKIVLIAHVSIINMASGIYLKEATGVLRPFVVWNKKQNRTDTDLRWKKHGRIMLLEAP